MLPRGYVVHRTEGRTRFRIPDRKGDASYFDRVERILSACDGVSFAAATPLTGSVLVYHDGPASRIGRVAVAEDLFTLAPHSEAESAAFGRATASETSTVSQSTPVIEQVAGAVDRADAFVRRTTRGAYDLQNATFLALLGGGVFQITRGRVFGAATSLLGQAVAMMIATRTPLVGSEASEFDVQGASTQEADAPQG